MELIRMIIYVECVEVIATFVQVTINYIRILVYILVQMKLIFGQIIKIRCSAILVIPQEYSFQINLIFPHPMNFYELEDCVFFIFYYKNNYAIFNV